MIFQILERIEQLILEISTVVTKEIGQDELVRRHGNEHDELNKDANATVDLGTELLNRLATPVIVGDGYVFSSFKGQPLSKDVVLKYFF